MLQIIQQSQDVALSNADIDMALYSLLLFLDTVCENVLLLLLEHPQSTLKPVTL
jgi:hypothetical protein